MCWIPKRIMKDGFYTTYMYMVGINDIINDHYNIILDAFSMDTLGIF